MGALRRSKPEVPPSSGRGRAGAAAPARAPGTPPEPRRPAHPQGRRCAPLQPAGQRRPRSSQVRRRGSRGPTPVERSISTCAQLSLSAVYCARRGGGTPAPGRSPLNPHQGGPAAAKRRAFPGPGQTLPDMDPGRRRSPISQRDRSSSGRRVRPQGRIGKVRPPTEPRRSLSRRPPFAQPRRLTAPGLHLVR